MAVFNTKQAFGSGGLTINSNPKGASKTTPAGPGFGYYGAKDLYKPPAGNVLGANASRGGSPSPQPQGQPDYSGVLQQQPSQPSIDFDALIAPAIQGLESAIGPLQQGFEETSAQLKSQAGTQKARATAQTGEAVSTLESRKTSESQNAENAADEARRQFSEVQQGLQARYGGTTGTGGFASEIAGAQTLKNIGAVRQQLSASLGEIDNKIAQVKELGNIALQDIDDTTQANILNAKQNLEAQLANIRRQKGELQSRKAQLAMDAMKIYQNEVARVNSENAQFKQQLFMQQQQAEQRLVSAREKGNQLIEQYKAGNYAPLIQTGQDFVKAGGEFSQSLPGGAQVNFRQPKKEEDDIESIINQISGAKF